MEESNLLEKNIIKYDKQDVVIQCSNAERERKCMIGVIRVNVGVLYEIVRGLEEPKDRQGVGGLKLMKASPVDNNAAILSEAATGAKSMNETTTLHEKYLS